MTTNAKPIDFPASPEKDKLKFTIMQLLNEPFADAFKKLLNDSAVPKALTWGLARSANKFNNEIKLFYKRRKKYTLTFAGADGKVVIPADKQEEYYDGCAKLAADIGLVEAYFSEPMKLHDPLPENSKLTADDLRSLMDTGLVYDPDPKAPDEDDSTESPSPVAPESEAPGNVVPN